MNIFKNKLIVSAPFIAFIVLFIFSLTLIPTVQPTPKNLPIAIVNLDKGVELPNQTEMNMGQTLLEMVEQSANASSNEEPAVNWMEVKSYEEVQIGLNDQKYYAALVIPSDFSEKQVSLRTPAPMSPEVQIYINQGMNTMASTMANNVLTGVMDNMNNNVRSMLLEEFNQQGGTLTTEQAASLVTPIDKTVINVNETGTNSANGNSPVSLFQPLWMASIASAAIIFISINKISFATRKEKIIGKSLQIVMGAIVALAAGFGLTWLADGMLGLHIPQFIDTALFLSITCLSFFLMISAVLSWLGIRGIVIFVLTLFFGGPLLAMAPEFMSTFYQDWIYSWLPMRFMVEGLRELFFFGKGLSWNHATSVLVGIGAVSIIVILASSFKPSKDNIVKRDAEA